MYREVVDLYLAVPPGTVIDATAGGGGHAGLLLDARSDLRLLGIDRDPMAVAAAQGALDRFGDRARIVHGGFENLAEIAESESEGNIVGVLFDLGVSSPQLDRAERGFSYWSDAPLDMRMDSSQSLTAADVVNGYDEAELVRIISRNGEEKFARRIARESLRRRPLGTTGELVDAIKAAIPAPARRTGGHPARRTFQAIRMEVNRELPNLAEGLAESVHLLTPGGRVLVLAYHSLEDRLVKAQFAEWSGTAPRSGHIPRGLPAPTGPAPLVRLLTRKPVRAGDDEVAENPRASSARLRAVERLGS
ncbi:MAG: 16S rRNA (cytosine(1402)-N(4))-methyltransferase RsmH [Acidimicrobiia bacterium]